MPVDKFGRGPHTTITTAGTLIEANRTFLRRDGENAAVGDINLDSHKLINVAAPFSDDDGVTKRYVDDQNALKFAKNGDVMNGDIAMNQHRITDLTDPTNSHDAATKRYVDTNLALYTKLDGTTPMTGDLDVGRHNVVNVTDPVDAQDAATKNYVDNVVRKTDVYTSNFEAQPNQEVQTIAIVPMMGPFVTTFDNNDRIFLDPVIWKLTLIGTAYGAMVVGIMLYNNSGVYIELRTINVDFGQFDMTVALVVQDEQISIRLGARNRDSDSDNFSLRCTLVVDKL